MIRPTKKLLTFINKFKTKTDFAEAAGIHGSTVSRILSGKSFGSSTTVAKILTLSGYEFDEAFQRRG